MSEELNIDKRIEEIDISIEAQKTMVTRAEALERLLTNDDFKLVMIDGYLDIEANRVFNLLTSPRVTKSEETASYLSQLDTIKDIARYLGDGDYPGTVAIQGANAKKAIDEMVAMKQELLASVKKES